MNDAMVLQADPRRDLVFERVVDVPAPALWAGWTRPELLQQWFTPLPWQTVDCRIDLRPGGIFSTVMRGPEGQQFANLGCYLEIVDGRKLVWTSTLGPGYRPAPAVPAGVASFQMTAIVALQAQGPRTRYTAVVLHADEAARERHEKMGFHVGWGKALDQLVALVGPAAGASAADADTGR